MRYELVIKLIITIFEKRQLSYFDKVYKVGSIINDKESTMVKSKQGFKKWSELDIDKRAIILEKIVKSFEDNKFELYALSVAGESIHNAINEVIKVIDFCILCKSSKVNYGRNSFTWSNG